METTTISTRIKKSEAKKLDQLAADLGLDRGALLKQIIYSLKGHLKNIAKEESACHGRRNWPR